MPRKRNKTSNRRSFLIGLISGAIVSRIPASAHGKPARQPRKQSPAELARLRRLWRIMARRHPAPSGCASIGIIEDGSQVAYRIGTGRYISIGPDTGDVWSPYSGKHMPVKWRNRARCLDHAYVPGVNCQRIVSEMPQQ